MSLSNIRQPRIKQLVVGQLKLQPSRIHHRFGTSLVELIVTMTIASSLFLMATAWIHQSFFLSVRMRENGRHHEQLMRLSRQLRDDIHASGTVELKSDFEIRLTVDDSRIEYSGDGSQIQRQVRAEKDDSLLSRDSFRLKEGVSIVWNVEDTDSNMPWVSCDVLRPTMQPNPGQPVLGLARPTDLRVRARLGRLAGGPS